MTTFDEDVKNWVAEDPEFAYELRLARAEASLGERVAATRQSRGLTQSELGQRMGVKQPSVARIEGADRTPTAETLWRIAEALDCEITFGPSHSVHISPSRSYVLATTFDQASPADLPRDEPTNSERQAAVAPAATPKKRRRVRVS